jgi:cobalt/nickel transport system ATP-binding protein
MGEKMERAIIETKGLDFSYLGRNEALKDIDLSIKEGSKTVFLGRNGAGKSTLFLHFNGILRPTRGEVLYDGRPIRYDSRSLNRLRYEVAVVLQNPDDQIFSATVEEDIAFGPMNQGLERKEVHDRVDEALAMVSMEELRKRPIQQLSFGQRKRVALAGALAMRPRVLIMDEPTAGLDPKMVHELFEIAEEQNKKGLTIILSTHDVETAYHWADEIMVLNDGRLKYSGCPEEFFKDTMCVHRLGLVTPALFTINQKFGARWRCGEQPYPKTMEEMVQKIAPLYNERTGRLTVVPVNGGAEPSVWEVAEGISKAVYGRKARRFIASKRVHVDFHFNAVENCIGEVTEGRDCILFIDEELLGNLKAKLCSLKEDFGLHIELSIGN